MNPVTNLSADEIPKQWYNAIPDLPGVLPAIKDPDDGFSRIELGKKIRPKVLTDQDNLEESWIDIPDEVLEKYLQVGRPTPLQRAENLEKYFDTPAKIYFKREDVLPCGSFKLNTSLAQAYYSKREGFDTLVTETGAGQWGVAVCMSAKQFGMDAKVFMARTSYRHKPYCATMMKVFNGEVYESPSSITEAGSKLLKEDSEHPGSIGTGISDAIETASKNLGRFAYVSGSNLPHVLLHQTIIGLETKKQLDKLSITPNALVACVGGGSNLGGFFLPFLKEKIAKKSDLQFMATESESVPRLTEGKYQYDFGDPAALTPLMKSYTLGHEFVPPKIHIGGLRQHSGSPIVGFMRHKKILDALAFSQSEVFEAGQLFLQHEGILPAPESCHAIRGAIQLALDAKEKNEPKNIVFCLSGSGWLDLNSYKKVLF